MFGTISLFEDEIVKDDEIENRFLEIYHEQVVIIWLAFVVEFFLEIQIYQHIVGGTSHHYYQHENEEKVHL
jgi:hypothetical protein